MLVLKSVQEIFTLSSDIFDVTSFSKGVTPDNANLLQGLTFIWEDSPLSFYFPLSCALLYNYVNELTQENYYNKGTSMTYLLKTVIKTLVFLVCGST